MRIGIACAVILAALLAAAPAIAQPAFDSIGKQGKAAPPAPKIPPPPALPGAESNANTAAPSSRPAADMEPNDALFDAINRGDIAAARDAINRGADLGARNILGMTPMELSIDLGRNDISFMLLSMRGAEGVSERPPPVAAAATKSPLGKQTKQVAARSLPVSTVRPAPALTARLYSGDGGTPVPSAGFLGFDSGRR
jgi:cell division septation protein DedD